MLGRMSSVISVIEILREKNVSPCFVVVNTTSKLSTADFQLRNYRVHSRSNQALGYRLELLGNKVARRKFAFLVQRAWF